MPNVTILGPTPSSQVIMKVWRRGHIGLEHKNFLDAHGVKHRPWSAPDVGAPVRKIDDYMFEIPEDHLAWPELERRLTKTYTYTETLFTDKERLTAEWCIIRGKHSIEALRAEGRGWIGEYYADQCSNCGAGWRQIKPFRLKKEPNLGKNQFSGFGRGFELFFKPLVLDEFAASGINGFLTWPLLLAKTDREVETLKQLIVTATAEPAIAEEFVEHERYRQTDCPVCGRTWHTHYVRGILPLRKAALKPNVDFQMTNEWFGSGRNARREILVSQRVVRFILQNKWKGAELVPIQAV
jgi:hypothetical protein